MRGEIKDFLLELKYVEENINQKPFQFTLRHDDIMQGDFI